MMGPLSHLPHLHYTPDNVQLNVFTLKKKKAQIFNHCIDKTQRQICQRKNTDNSGHTTKAYNYFFPLIHLPK